MLMLWGGDFFTFLVFLSLEFSEVFLCLWKPNSINERMK